MIRSSYPLKGIIKNFFRRLIGILILSLIFPFLIFLYILIYIINGSPVIFKSKRKGYKNKDFTLYKFRTMTNEYFTSDRTVTGLGRFLRRSSLDELPQVLNIVLGEMSLVGPRPYPKESYQGSRMNRYKIERTSVLPGLTGFAQIKTKGKPRSKDRKLTYDIVYIRKKSILLDIYILAKTMKTLYIRFAKNKSGETL